jgi:hypothetical protein
MLAHGPALLVVRVQFTLVRVLHAALPARHTDECALPAACCRAAPCLTSPDWLPQTAQNPSKKIQKRYKSKSGQFVLYYRYRRIDAVLTQGGAT